METLSSQVTEQQSGGITEMTQSVKKVLDSEVKRVSNVLSDKENDSEDDDYSYEDKQWGDEYSDNGDEFLDYDDSNHDDSNRDENYRIRPKFFNKINMKIKKKSKLA
jgi:hypothetical protein